MREGNNKHPDDEKSLETGDGGGNGSGSASGSHHYHNYPFFRQFVDFRIIILFLVVALSCLVLYQSAYHFQFFYRSSANLSSDADIMWFRDPFAHFDTDADFQISCDYFRGNSSDIYNSPNSGFIYAKSNHQTIQFYKFWYTSRERFPGLHDQDVLNKLRFDPFTKNNTELEIRFLDTAYFGGFCQPSRNLNEVCTMHANCCVGLDNKVNDLRIMLEDWRKYMALTVDEKASKPSSWTVPQNCSTSFSRPHKSQNQNNDQGSNN